jgi:hypothetical protein
LTDTDMKIKVSVSFGQSLIVIVSQDASSSGVGFLMCFYWTESKASLF